MPKVEPDKESQRKRKRQLTIENSEPSNRGAGRRISLADVPISIRNGDGSQLYQIQTRSSQHIGNAIQQLGRGEG